MSHPLLPCLAVGLGLLAAAPAWAQDFTMPWTDPYERPAPDTMHLDIATAFAFDATDYQFFRGAAGMPFFASEDGAWSFGVNLEMGVVLFGVGKEGRFGAQPLSLRGEAWFTFFGPERRSHHAIVLGGGAPPRQVNTAFLDHRETNPHGGLAYDGYLWTKPVDVSLRVDVGADVLQIVHATASVSATFKVAEIVGLQLGARGGLTSLQVVHGGVRLRPFPALEIGVGAAAAIVDLEGGHFGIPIAPTLDLVAFDARGPRHLWPDDADAATP